MKTYRGTLICWLVVGFLVAWTAEAHAQAPGAMRGRGVAQRPHDNPKYKQARKGPWCGAAALWQSKGPQQAAAANGCGQGDCDDPGVRDATSVAPLLVNVIVHVVHNGSNVLSQATVDATIAQMNADYGGNGTDIQFNLVATRYHLDSALADIARCSLTSCSKALSDISKMKNKYAENPDEQCNIFISGQDSSPFGVLLGVGTFPWDSDALTKQGGIWMNEIAAGPGGGTATHEIGHCLGLWHTHHGVSEVASCSSCYEFASGAEGDVRGDFCGDTPPTPTNYTCSDPGGTDCQGTAWGNTQPENYMSYAPDSCLGLFTAQQTLRQQCWTNNVLSGWSGAPCAADSDQDGLCDDVDPCPNDPDNDFDNDGLCADVDPCPEDSTNTCNDPSATPSVTGCAPSSGSRGQSLTVTVTGSNFVPGATVDFGQRVAVRRVTVVSSGELEVRIRIHRRAASGPRDVTVTHPDGQSDTAAGCFSVN